MVTKKIKIDSITKDKNGKILVIGVDGEAITDPKEIQKLVDQEKKEEKKEVSDVR